MQTILEQSDIDTENNPIHKAIYSNLQIFYILALLSLPKEGTDKEKISEDLKRQIASGVAVFLNGLEKEGLSIVKSEIPAAFK